MRKTFRLLAKSVLWMVIAVMAMARGSVPANAVLKESNLNQTISVLRAELENSRNQMRRQMARYYARVQEQHNQMVSTMQRSEQIALMLYSQREDYTFDLTYACNEATDQYRQFTRQRMPYDKIIARLDAEIIRYQNLIEALEALPPRYQRATAGLRPEALSKSGQSTAGLRPEALSGSGRSAAAGNMPSPLAMQGQGNPKSASQTKQSANAIAANAPIAIGGDTLPVLKDSIDSVIHFKMRMAAQKSSKKNAFVLSPTVRKYRDACVEMAQEMLGSLEELKRGMEDDHAHYSEIEKQLKKVNDYAQHCYAQIQNNIFRNAGENYFSMLARLGTSVNEAKADTEDKYRQETINTKDGVSIRVHSQWRGPGVIFLAVFIIFYLLIAAALSSAIMRWLVPKKLRTDEFKKKQVCLTLVAAVLIFAIVITVVRTFMGHNNFMLMASGLLIEFAWLVGVILISLLVRLTGNQIRSGFSIYAPVMLMGFVVIVFRVIFIPNNLVNLILPPLLLLFTWWQWVVIRRHNKNIPRMDIFYTWVSLIIMVAGTVASWAGYTLAAVQLLIWWIFQLTCIQTITCLFDLLHIYEARRLVQRVDGLIPREKKNGNGHITSQSEIQHAIDKLNKNKGAYITQTWLFDFVYMALVPVLGVMSVMWSIFWAADVFNMTDSIAHIFLIDFVSIQGYLNLSIQKIVLVVSLWFVFRYISYLLKALYKKYRGNGAISGAKPNITLANNIIAILVWGSFIVMCMVMLHIPSGAISIITAGLATGLGFAMKDLLENFVYGISLMTGRIRVGDYIECDGIRGRVESITYQSTQLATADGSIIAFLNSALFTKNFKNLTKSHNYEMVKVPVGVAYGSDLKAVREMLIEAVSHLRAKNKEGRDIISRKLPMDVLVDEFGDNSVNLFFTYWVLVEEKAAMTSRVKETIYNTLNQNHIEIPFPQRDVHLIPAAGAVSVDNDAKIK